MLNRLLKKLYHDQRGITGLETAIILIAFVVVASVFAYTVLSAGIFSSEKGKEAVYSGLEQARSSMEVVGGVKAVGVTATTISSCDTAWTGSANVTATAEATDKKEGDASAKLAIADAFTTGLIAYKDVSSMDLSSHYSARLWIKSDTDLAAGALQLLLDDTAACASPLETIDLPAITAANGWTRVQLKLANPSALTAVISVGLKATVDPGIATVYADLVEAPGEVTQLAFMVSNALQGAAIDLTTTTDANNNGVLSDEATQSHVMYASYVDKNQRVNDLAWTATQMGKGNDDTQLDPGEKFLITVNLKALNPMPVDDTAFSLDLRPQSGSTLVIDRTVPAVVTTTMDLK